MKNVRKIVGIALVVVIGLTFAVCDNGGGGGGGDGGNGGGSKIDLEEIGFDTDDIYGPGPIPPAPTNEQQATTVFTPVYTVLEARYLTLQSGIDDYVDSRLAGKTSIDETASLSEISASYAPQLLTMGISNLSGTVRIIGSQNQTSGNLTITISPSYNYDSDDDTSYDKYSGDRLFAKINATYTYSMSGNQTSFTDSESLNLSSDVVFADTNYCGKGTFATNYRWTWSESATNPNGTYVVNSAGGRFTFYDLEDTQTYTRTLTKSEAEELFRLGQVGIPGDPYGSMSPRGSIAPVFEKRGLQKFGGIQ